MVSGEELYKFIENSQFHCRYSHSSTCYESELNDRLRLLELLVNMIDLESLGYSRDVYGKDILHYKHMKEFRVAIDAYIRDDDEEIDSQSSNRKFVKPYLERVAYYHDIKILENQSSKYYINILKVFKYVYDLIQNNKTLASLILSLWWVQRIFAGRWQPDEFSDEIHALIDDENSDYDYIMELMLKPHINTLRNLSSNGCEECEEPDENLINDFKESYGCRVGADDATYGSCFHLIVPIYNIIRDAILNPKSLQNSEQLRQFVSLITNFRKYV